MRSDDSQTESSCQLVSFVLGVYGTEQREQKVMSHDHSIENDFLNLQLPMGSSKCQKKKELFLPSWGPKLLTKMPPASCHDDSTSRSIGKHFSLFVAWTSPTEYTKLSYLLYKYESQGFQESHLGFEANQIRSQIPRDFRRSPAAAAPKSCLQQHLSSTWRLPIDRQFITWVFPKMVGFPNNYYRNYWCFLLKMTTFIFGGCFGGAPKNISHWFRVGFSTVPWCRLEAPKPPQITPGRWNGHGILFFRVASPGRGGKTGILPATFKVLLVWRHFKSQVDWRRCFLAKPTCFHTVHAVFSCQIVS